MAHPWHHALSSVKQFGGITEDYLHLHHWMDETKMFFADFRHRALRHHVEGVSLGATLFGELLTNTDGCVVLVRDVLTQHLHEDCGQLVHASDWLECMKSPSWFNGLRKSMQEAKDFLFHRYNRGEYHAGINQLVDWFYLPYGLSICDNPNYGLFRSHSAGIFHAEALFDKSVIDFPYQQVPVRVLGEVIVKAQLGRIPTVEDWVLSVKSEYWMIRTNKIERSL